MKSSFFILTQKTEDKRKKKKRKNWLAKKWIWVWATNRIGLLAFWLFALINGPFYVNGVSYNCYIFGKGSWICPSPISHKPYNFPPIIYIYIYTREKRMQLCIARKFYFPVVISINCIIRLQLNISSKHIKIMKIHTWLVSYKLRKQNSTWKGCHPHLENSKVYNLLKGCFRSTGMG